MQSGEELLEKQFSTHQQALSYMVFLSNLDVNEILLRREGNFWSVKYHATRSVIYLEEAEFSLVE